MRTMRKVICSMLALIMVLGMLPAAALADVEVWEGTVGVEMVSHFGEATLTDTAYYSDKWFLEDSAQTNYALALMSAMACGASYGNPSEPNGQKIIKLLEAMHYSDLERNQYYVDGSNEENSIACIIGSKTIADESGEYTLLAVFPRNAGYIREWAGNFNLGAEGDHTGFSLARDQVLEFMGQYLTKYSITGNVKVWCAGYSRGGATANMVGGCLAENGSYFDNVAIAPKDIFVYTIGTPLTVAASQSDLSAYPYSGIHNFVAYGDYITKLPPTGWGFTRYGVTEFIEYGDGEMRAWLQPISAETAAAFAGGGYSVAKPFKTLDLNTLSMADAGGEISPDKLLEACKVALMNLGSRAEFVDQNYARVLGVVATLFGMDNGQFAANISEVKTGELVSAALLNYLVYAAAQQGNVSESAAAAEVLVQILKYAGIEIDVSARAYTGKQMVADLLDYAFNDLKSSDPEKKKAAETRFETVRNLLPEQPAVVRGLVDGLKAYIVGSDVQLKTIDDLVALTSSFGFGNPLNRAVIGGLIPQDYQPLYNDLVTYAVANDALPRSIDDAVSLMTHFIVANADAEPEGSVRKLLEELVQGIPDTTQALIRMVLPGAINKRYDATTGLDVIILDCFRACNEGVDWGDSVTPAKQFRTSLLRMVFSFVLRVGNIGEFLFDPNNSVKAEGLIDDVFKLALPKNESGTSTLTLAQAADKALADLLDAGLGEQGAENPYAAELKENLPTLRTLVTTIVLRPGEGYDLKSDVKNAATFIDQIGFMVPAHYHELYISWLKTKVYTRNDYVPASSSATVTVPVSGEDATVNVKVEVKGDSAVIKEADIDKVLEAKEVGTVTIDVSGLEKGIDEVVLPAAMVKKIADAVADQSNDADGLKIKLPTGSVAFDAGTLAAIKGQADGKDLTLHLNSVKVTELTSAQQNAVKELEIEVVLDAFLTAGGQRITDFKGGSAVLEIPYSLKPGQTAAGLVVWYVADDGTKTQVPASYDGKNIVFSVPHFSNYVVAYDAEKGAACPKDSTCPMSAFTDLDPAAWYHDGIHWALETGLMNGVAGGKFDPNGTTTRAMIVTILYRMEGEPMIRSGMPFNDVTESDWYAMAVSWAESQGIIDGYGDGRFGPNDPITREQLAAILYRYAKLHGEGFKGLWSFKLDFPDAADVADWAAEAVSWMVMQSVITGMDGKLAPQGNATRAQAAAMFQRFALEV